MEFSLVIFQRPYIEIHCDRIMLEVRMIILNTLIPEYLTKTFSSVTLKIENASCIEIFVVVSFAGSSSDRSEVM